MINPEPRLPLGCAESPLGSGVVVRICTIAGRAPSANCTKARLSRSSSELPGPEDASRHVKEGWLDAWSCAGNGVGHSTKKPLIRIAENFTFTPPGTLAAFSLSKSFSQNKQAAAGLRLRPTDVVFLARRAAASAKLFWLSAAAAAWAVHWPWKRRAMASR